MPECIGAPRIWQKREEQPGVWGRKPQPPEATPPEPPANFCDFHVKKKLILAHLYTEKGHAVSAVTIDNAKIFSQLMSKIRSLAKICERRLQPILV